MKRPQESEELYQHFLPLIRRLGDPGDHEIDIALQELNDGLDMLLLESQAVTIRQSPIMLPASSNTGAERETS